MLKGWFSGRSRTWSGPEGCRAYAVGDVHGRLDLLEPLLARIEEDHRAREASRGFVIFLGDLIDRGPNSAGVVERLRNYRPGGLEPIFLAGNHEEVLLRVLGGEGALLPEWLEFGGAELVSSYGLDPVRVEAAPLEEALAMIRDGVPASHADFIASFADTFRFGDYLFVHAGIRPGIAVENQSQGDLRWIREPFLSDRRNHGFVVIHGHTISREVSEGRNRIGIDTGAYRSGRLTAIGIEGQQSWYLVESAVDEREKARGFAQQS